LIREKKTAQKKARAGALPLFWTPSLQTPPSGGRIRPRALHRSSSKKRAFYKSAIIKDRICTETIKKRWLHIGDTGPNFFA
jgi:hypothetical protein